VVGAFLFELRHPIRQHPVLILPLWAIWTVVIEAALKFCALLLQLGAFLFEFANLALPRQLSMFALVCHSVASGLSWIVGR
jgi:hypothetical protein